MTDSIDPREERERKLQLLRDAGMDPYPAHTGRTHDIGSVITDFERLVREGEAITIAGRIMAIRGHGALLFVDLFDGTGKIQGFLSKDTLGEAKFSLFESAMNPGDFISISGEAYLTNRGTQAINTEDWKVLSKALLNIPTEHFGIKDEDERFRKRYLDILLDSELQELIRKKSLFWETTRAFLKANGFLEVETPSLELTTGGAEARPFMTHHNDFDIDVFMRISVGELWQKRLMAAGLPRTFEIGRVYRNEGTSPEHLQEFTNMEFYWAYADYEDGMELVKDLYRTIAREVFGTTKFETRGHHFDLANEWAMIDYVSEVEKQTGINVLTASLEEMMAKADELGISYEGKNKERLTDTLWKYCRKHIAGPAFLINHPLIVAPLAKKKADGTTVEMFQPIIAGSEVGRGYSELNDPIDQRERFEAQQKLIESGDDEAMMPDWEFVEMLEYGMPPTCGFGFGERLFAFLSDKPLRETQLFPLMKPRQ